MVAIRTADRAAGGRGSRCCLRLRCWRGCSWFNVDFGSNDPRQWDATNCTRRPGLNSSNGAWKKARDLFQSSSRLPIRRQCAAGADGDRLHVTTRKASRRSDQPLTASSPVSESPTSITSTTSGPRVVQRGSRHPRAHAEPGHLRARREGRARGVRRVQDLVTRFPRVVRDDARARMRSWATRRRRPS